MVGFIKVDRCVLSLLLLKKGIPFSILALECDTQRTKYPLRTLVTGLEGGCEFTCRLLKSKPVPRAGVTRTTLRSTDFKSLNGSLAQYRLLLLSASVFTKRTIAVNDRSPQYRRVRLSWHTSGTQPL
jgi:hypothetical protein